jgi:hypothetical protein
MRLVVSNDSIPPRRRREASVTKAQMKRALDVAREAWGDNARVIVNPDRTITIERAEGHRGATKPQHPPHREMIL